MPPVCPKCKGKKHVPGADGAMVRCDCIKEATERRVMEEAGVPPVMFSVPVGDLHAGSFLAGKNFDPAKDYKRVVMLWVKAPQISRTRAYTIAYFLKAAVTAGRSACRLSLTRTVDAYFDRDAKLGLLTQLRNTDSMVFELDAELTTKMLPQVLSDVLQIRAGVPSVTMFVSSDDVPEMTGRYGPELAQAFATMPMIRLGEFRREIGGNR